MTAISTSVVAVQFFIMLGVSIADPVDTRIELIDFDHGVLDVYGRRRLACSFGDIKSRKSMSHPSVQALL